MNRKSVQTTFSSRSLIGWTFAAILALGANAAGAAVLYEQPPVDVGNGYYANTNWPQQIADDFTLGDAVTLERITWWGGYAFNVDNNDDDFLVRIYTGVSGTGTVTQEFSSAAFTRTATALADGANNDVYQYDFDLSVPLPLSSGDYYLFVQNLGTSDWFWLEGSAGNGNLWYRGDDTDPWNVDSGDLALRLEGTHAYVIPEPSTLALFGVAGLPLAMAGWRLRRRLTA